MKLKVGHSVRIINAEMLRQYAENGIEVLELGLPLNKDVYKKADYVTFKKIIGDIGADFTTTKKLIDDSDVAPHSFHLPFHPGSINDPASLEDEIFNTTVDIQKLTIEKAAYLGCKIAVIHPSREPYLEEERPARIAASQRVLALLADFAAKMNIQIAVENLPRTCLGRSSAEILELLKADDRLRVCYDTNHLLGESAESFIKACGDKIVTLHVSDYDFLDERHWLPGEGKNDWETIIRLLDEVGYNGPWLYEVGLNTSETIIRPRNLTYADLRRNAEEIFAGKVPTAIGKPAPGLLHWKEKMALKEAKK